MLKISLYIRSMFRSSIYLVLCLMLLWSCARKGSPKGGPIDSYAPKILKENPINGSKNVPLDLKEIRIEIDEYAILKDQNKQILISPAFENQPTISPSQNGPKKYILIKLKDSLKPNTTYNFNFGESIQDNTEGNALSDYQYTISTGEFIDSLQLKGNVINTHEEVIDLSTIVALYKKGEVDLRKKPYYITKIDTLGNFQLKYLSEGSYDIVSFVDTNGNVLHDEDEAFGFGKEAVTITNTTEKVTIFLSKITPKISFDKIESIDEGQLKAYFKGKPKSIELVPISANFPKEYILQHKAYSDTATVWFKATKDAFENKNERLEFALSLPNKKDTISVTYNTKQDANFLLKSENKELIKGSVFRVDSNHYLQSISKELITVSKADKPIEFTIETHEMYFNLVFPIDFDAAYKVLIKDKAVTDFLGKSNQKLEVEFTTKSIREYGNLIVTLTNVPTKPYFIQLLKDDKVSVSRYIKNRDSVIEFTNVKPDEYTMRILVDENENEIWDAGNWEEKAQPEPTYFFPNYIEIRPYWDINETWIVQ